MTTINSDLDTPLQEPEQGSAEVCAKTYEKPVLVSYGDVRDITLGPTIGTGESGNAAIFRNI